MLSQTDMNRLDPHAEDQTPPIGGGSTAINSVSRPAAPTSWLALSTCAGTTQPGSGLAAGSTFIGRALRGMSSHGLQTHSRLSPTLHVGVI